MALAMGVEKMGGGLLQLNAKPTYEARLGLDLFPLLFGLKQRQYMDDFAVSPQDIAAISVKARDNAVRTLHVSASHRVTIEEVLAAPVIADPVTRLQCCANADGAAAIVVKAARPGDGLPRVRGWEAALCTDDPNEPMAGGWDSRERIVARMARQLYEKNGTGPEDIDIVQLNDAFSIAEPLYLEALGFAMPGQGIELQREGSTGPGGRLPTNTDGGLLGRGHSLGATGLAMVYEVVTQMTGRAGSRQVAKTCRTGLVQSHGYGGENLFLLTIDHHGRGQSC